MRREGLVHHGIQLRFDRRGHRIDFDALAGGRGITVYGQQEVVKDLVAARLAAAAPVVFEASDVVLEEITQRRPRVCYRLGADEHALECDFIAGCDGFHGPSRAAIPASALTIY